MIKKMIAEFIGTFWLVFAGCGSAIFAAGYPELGIGFVGVSIAFGLSVLTMVYAIGHISGCHLNPAVSIGLWIANRFKREELLPYIVSQLVGAAFAAWLLFTIASGKDGFEPGGFAANGFGEASPGGYSMMAALITEVVMTLIFLFVILGATSSKAPGNFAGVAIGLCLTLIHLVSIPITNTSVNPARSTSQALFAEGPALEQLWLFWVAPIAGAILAGLLYRYLNKE